MAKRLVDQPLLCDVLLSSDADLATHCVATHSLLRAAELALPRTDRLEGLEQELVRRNLVSLLPLDAAAQVFAEFLRLRVPTLYYLALGANTSYKDLYPEAALDDKALASIARDRVFQTRLQAVTMLPAYYTEAVKLVQSHLLMDCTGSGASDPPHAASSAPLGPSQN